MTMPFDRCARGKHPGQTNRDSGNETDQRNPAHRRDNTDRTVKLFRRSQAFQSRTTENIFSHLTRSQRNQFGGVFEPV